MVANDRAMLQLTGYIFLVSFLLQGFLVWQTWNDAVDAGWGVPLLSFFSALLFLLLGGLFLARSRRWKQVNYRRQMAAAWGFAARVPLAYPHPLPNVAALPLPSTIKLKPTWLKFLAVFCLVASMGILVDVWVYSVWGEHDLLATAHQLFQFDIPFSVILLCLVGLSMLRLLRTQRIEITPEGLIVRHALRSRMGSDTSFRQQAIRWSDARLFAIRDGDPETPAIYYELSGPSAVVSWKRVRRNRWYSLYRPAIPFAEYDAQMEALIALISGITGLPLYDVR